MFSVLDHDTLLINDLLGILDAVIDQVNGENHDINKTVKIFFYLAQFESSQNIDFGFETNDESDLFKLMTFFGVMCPKYHQTFREADFWSIEMNFIRNSEVVSSSKVTMG